jgi:hypothetical protein
VLPVVLVHRQHTTPNPLCPAGVLLSQEVRPLTRLPYLTDVCFADPMWGECPLASLCNYQT